jgi:hypothetical protein
MTMIAAPAYPVDSKATEDSETKVNQFSRFTQLGGDLNDE